MGVSCVKSVDLLIKNGSIVSPGGISQADIGIANGKIVTLGDLGGVSAANVIDAKNINFIREKAIDSDINFVLSNSFGFGGTNVSLILKKFNESKLQ